MFLIKREFNVYKEKIRGGYKTASKNFITLVFFRGQKASPVVCWAHNPEAVCPNPISVIF